MGDTNKGSLGKRRNNPGNLRISLRKYRFKDILG